MAPPKPKAPPYPGAERREKSVRDKLEDLRGLKRKAGPGAATRTPRAAKRGPATRK